VFLNGAINEWEVCKLTISLTVQFGSQSVFIVNFHIKIKLWTAF